MISGSFEAQTSNKYINGTVNWTSTLDSLNNTSSVTASMTLIKQYHSPESTVVTSGIGTWILYINEVPYQITVSKTFGFSSGTTVISNTVTVPHNVDGTKQCNIRITGGIAGTSYTSTRAESTVNLETNVVKATILTAPDFTDLENPTITFSNPKNYPLQFKIEDRTGYNNLIVTDKLVDYEGDSYTFNLTNEQRDILRNASQNYTDFPMRFTVSTYIPAESETPTYFSWLDRNMHVTAGSPDFFEFSFEDSNPYTASITGDNSKFIQHYSKFRVYIKNEDKMITYKDADGKGYSLIVGDKSDYQQYSETLDVVFSEINTEIMIYNIRVTAFDSRNKYTIVDQPVTMFPYDVKKNTAKISAYRQNGFSSVLVVNVDGTYNPIVIGGINKNTISVVLKYRILNSSDPWIVEEYNVYSGEDGTFTDSRTFNVNANYNYELQISVSDTFDSIGDIYEGKTYSDPIFYVDDDYRIGINMVPDGTDQGLYLKDNDVFYDRFKTYFDNYLYNGLYEKIAQSLYPVGSCFTTDYEITDVNDIPVPDSTWTMNYKTVDEDGIPVIYFHLRTE